MEDYGGSATNKLIGVEVHDIWEALAYFSFCNNWNRLGRSAPIMA